MFSSISTVKADMQKNRQLPQVMTVKTYKSQDWQAFLPGRITIVTKKQRKI